jgi:predicted methyltransferase
MRTLFVAAFVLGAGAPAFAADSALNAALTDSGRPPLELARDGQRKPEAVIAFAGVKPGQAVVDFVPGDGYYTRIFSKLEGAHGRVYALVPAFQQAVPARKAALEDMKKGGSGMLPVDAVLSLENMAGYSNILVTWQMLSTVGGQFALPEQAEIVFSMDGYHELHGKAAAKVDIPAVTRAIFAGLKPGGVYVVGDASAVKGSGFAGADALHRSDEGAVIAEILPAGFALDSESEALANAGDDRSKPADDGSDHFLLRFVKPKTAPRDQRLPHSFLDGWYGNTAMYSPGTGHARAHIYRADGTYDEYGPSDVQGGRWFADASGNVCMLHEYPADARGFTDCHLLTAHKVGDNWLQKNGNQDVPITMLAGIVRKDSGAK